MSNQVEAPEAVPAGIGFFEKKLSLWVGLCSAAGILLFGAEKYQHGPTEARHSRAASASAPIRDLKKI